VFDGRGQEQRDQRGDADLVGEVRQQSEMSRFQPVADEERDHSE
jgi:hypothetical protein